MSLTNMQITRKAVAVMREINPKHGDVGGNIVNVSSIGGRVAYPAHAGYHAAKFALEGFSEAIATELDPSWKIRVLILEPGGTRSSFLAKSQEDGVPRHRAYSDEGLPVNQMLRALNDPKVAESFVEPEEVAKCLFKVLGSDDMPLRLPTGKDAWAAVHAKEKLKTDELNKWKAVSEGVGGTRISGA
jgi:NAD(P)-dependent dehydrogenase (short-subunit alcohol dehydrogenase family)